MHLEDCRLRNRFRWLCLSLFLRSVLSAAVTDTKCACGDFGSCIFTTDVYAGLQTKRNVAVGKTAKMSSLYRSARSNETSGPACLAVNGKIDTTFRPVDQFPDSPNCIHTGDDDRDPYWEVDLGQRYSINSITVYWRGFRLQERSDGVKVTVDGKLCHTFRSPVSNPLHFVCSTQLAGQAVRLSKNDHTTPDDYFITVCEVEVWVVTTSSPATSDITKLVFPIVGAVLGGAVVIGICIAGILWLGRSRDRRLGLTAGTHGVGSMLTAACDIGRSEVRGDATQPTTHLSGLHDNQTQEDYVNLHDVSDVPVQGRKGNKYNALPTRKSDNNPVSTDLSDDEEYEEMK